MPRQASSDPALDSVRLADGHVARRGDQWWLVGDSGSMPIADLVFNGELDQFAAAMSAADRAVAALRSAQHGNESDTESR